MEGPFDYSTMELFLDFDPFVNMETITLSNDLCETVQKQWMSGTDCTPWSTTIDSQYNGGDVISINCVNVYAVEQHAKRYINASVAMDDQLQDQWWKDEEEYAIFSTCVEVSHNQSINALPDHLGALSSREFDGQQIESASCPKNKCDLQNHSK